jgi:hypothetical protein
MGMDPLLALSLMIFVAIAGFALGTSVAVYTGLPARRPLGAPREYIVPYEAYERPRPQYRTAPLTVSPVEVAIDVQRLPRSSRSRRDLRLPR